MIESEDLFRGVEKEEVVKRLSEITSLKGEKKGVVDLTY
tara:strand:- start:1839 stop:1955 length:117 start_codon:yes stop_codon:yes gene_type:complete